MAKNQLMNNIIIIIYLVIFLNILNNCYTLSNNNFTISSFTYSKTTIKPYNLIYITVVLPTWFSSMSVSLESDVGLDSQSLKGPYSSKLPMICLREGSFPLPDSYNVLNNFKSNGFFGDLQGLRLGELCYPMRKNVSIQFTNEQILPGVWYWGFFNGIGPTRTQSKMINRGTTYSISGNISVEGCGIPTLLGPSCDQTINMLPCNNQVSMANNISHIISCQNADGNSCHENDEPKIYSLDLLGIMEQLSIRTTNVTGNSSGIMLTCYARYGSIPTPTLYDYSANISDHPLLIRLPKVGQWYFAVYRVGMSNVKVCYLLNSQLQQCSEGKAGLNCTWERYKLQTILRKSQSLPFESYYLPTTKTALSALANFLLEPLLSNSSFDENGFAWTYFHFDIPSDATGANLHIRLTSDAIIHRALYMKYGGLPSLDSWDYYYANTTSNSNGSTSFKLYDSSDELVSFYILYARVGTWSVGIRHSSLSNGSSKAQTTMSISLERCPKRCSSHGSCKTALDASGLSLYSYCECDRNHGGFDCSIEIVSQRGHISQSIFLIASNAAALLPSYWCLRHKAFAEWVLFMCSGISSAIYHSCDTATWCASNFTTLQFMDFWLSFMAVVSTFVYLTDINEVSKRGIHTVVAIVTAFLAITAPTRSSNIGLVIAIGASGLLIGWLIEFFTWHHSLSLPFHVSLNITERWGTAKEWLCNSIKLLVKRFRWWVLIVAFAALAMAAVSWTMEANESYWIWHSLWHISIYTSSFLFLCSKAKKVVCDDPAPPQGNYMLTRQDSSSRNQ